MSILATKHTVSDNWTCDNLAYLAGLLEGEGYFGTNNNCIRIQLRMTDEDVVRKASEIAGIGSFRGPFKNGMRLNGLPCKSRWSWEVTKQKDVYALMVAVYPWMGMRRREKIRELIKLWNDKKCSQVISSSPKISLGKL